MSTLGGRTPATWFVTLISSHQWEHTAAAACTSIAVHPIDAAAGDVNAAGTRPSTVLHPPPVSPFWLPNLSNLLLQCSAATSETEWAIWKQTDTETECDAEGAAAHDQWQSQQTMARNCVGHCRSTETQSVCPICTCCDAGNSIVSSWRDRPMLQACFVVGYILAATQGSSTSV